jgi:hypothetical protein
MYLFAWVLFTITNLFANQLKIDLVTELHLLEGKAGQVFLADKLWEINSATGQIDVYDITHKKIASVHLPHTLSHLQIYDSSHVIVLGKLHSPWRFYLTTVNATSFNTQTFELKDDEFFPDEFIVSPSKEVFLSDIPAKSVWRYRLGGRLTQMPVTVEAPGKMAISENTLYVIENFGLGTSKSNLVKIDLMNYASSKLFQMESLPDRVASLQMLSDGKTLAAAQVWADALLLIDTRTDSVKRVLPISGGPRDMAEIGNCLITLSEQTKTVSFVNTSTYEMVSTWDLSPAGDRLKQPNSLSVDRARGRVYARSAYPCMGCTVTQSSVFVAEEAEAKTFPYCLKE